MKQWRPIGTAPDGDCVSVAVDLWLEIYPSPRSFGIGDSFRVTECWKKNGKWVHVDDGEIRELYQPYITHWMPMPTPPEAA